MDIVRQRRVILRPIEDGWRLTQGATKEEALENIKDAIQGYIAVLEEDGRPIPEDDYQKAELTAV